MGHVGWFQESIPALFFLQRHSTHENIIKYQRVGKGEILSWESQSSSNIVRVEV